MPKSLTDLTTNEVSLVKRGAVNRRFAVKKEATVDQILKAVLEQPADGEDAVRAALEKSDVSPQGRDAVLGAVRILSAFRDVIPAEIAKAAPKMAGYANDEAHDYAEGGGKGKFPAKKKMKKDMADGDGDEDEDEEDEEEHKFPPSKKKKATYKSADLPADARAHLEAIEKAQQEAVEKAAQLERELQAERDVRLNKEFVEKAQRDFGTLGPAKDIGPVLKSLHAVDGDLATKVERLLKQATERVKTAALFAERGRDGSAQGDEDTAWGQIQKRASELVSKSADGNMSHAQAVALVMQRDPELYERYKSEHNYFRVGGTGGR